MISLGERLVNEDEPECRKMIAQCISSMLQKLPKIDRDPLFEIVILWFKDKNVSIVNHIYCFTFVQLMVLLINLIPIALANINIQSY